MAANTINSSPVNRIFQVLRLDRHEILTVYFYAIIGGLIQLSLPLGIQSIISFVLGGSISSSLVILIVFVVLGVFINGWIQVKQMQVIEKVQQKLFLRYAFEYSFRVPLLDQKIADREYLPELMNRFFDVPILQKGVAKLLLDFPTAIIQVFFGMILVSFYHPVFIVFSIALVSLVVLILYFSGSKGLDTSIKESDFKYQVASWLEELAKGIKSFKYLKSGQYSMKRMDGLVSSYLTSRTKHYQILQFQYWALIGLKVVITAAMLIVGSILLINQQLNLGQFVAAEIVILLILNSVEKLIINLDKVYDVLTAVEKLGKVLDKPIEINGKLTLPLREEGIAIKVYDLSFGYTDKLVIDHLDFNVKGGEKMTVSGKDGSGKTSLLKILSGMYRDYRGVINMDEIPVKEMEINSLRSQTGVMIGSGEIFQGSLLDNISMGNEHIEVSSIIKLAGELGFDDFSKEFPDGWYTGLNSVGHQISKSQVKKILLLRALIGRPRLLLLDEPWLGLDDTTAGKIQEFLIGKTQNVTVLVTTNDSSFAARCHGRIELPGN